MTEENLARANYLNKQIAELDLQLSELDRASAQEKSPLAIAILVKYRVMSSEEAIIKLTNDASTFLQQQIEQRQLEIQGL